MGKIFILDQQVIASIAAGEVILRPVDVVKELVENSLDAQATHIYIELRRAGLDLISVTDNGIGVEKADLELAVTPHATSKITRADDLHSITSFGFRGEALASISQVSLLTLSSRLTQAESGYQIKVEYGKAYPIKPVPLAQGTQVVVNSLFDHTPVRKAFLLKSNQELKLITQYISAMALAYPTISFSLRHNLKYILETTSQQSLVQRVQQLFGNELYQNLLPVQVAMAEASLTGFISQPSQQQRIAPQQLLYINRRLVKHQLLKKSIVTAYKQLHTNPIKPSFILFLELQPKDLDVNVHPRKQEVDIFNGVDLSLFLEEKIISVLKDKAVQYSPEPEMNWHIKDGSNAPYGAGMRRQLMQAYKHSTAQQRITGEITQLRDLYLLVPTTQGLLIVDQHALDERFLYDELKQLFQLERKRQATIEVNILFDLPLSDATFLEENLEIFQRLGIQIEAFGPNTFRISHMPQLLAELDLKQIIFEIIEDIQVGKEPKLVDTQSDKILASMACRLAVKAGDFLSPQKRKELIEDLLTKDTPGTCPHGRPVFIVLSFNQLEHLFQRR